jgi:hypothetical protein
MHMNQEPFSCRKAINGAIRFSWAFLKCKIYPPIIIRPMPTPPQWFMDSPRIKNPVKIMKAGVKARNGTDREIGEIFMA